MVSPRNFETPVISDLGRLPLSSAYNTGEVVGSGAASGENSPSFVTPRASQITPQSSKRGTGLQEETFGIRTTIFGQAQKKNMKVSPRARHLQEYEAKKKAEEEARRK